MIKRLSSFRQKKEPSRIGTGQGQEKEREKCFIPAKIGEQYTDLNLIGGKFRERDAIPVPLLSPVLRTENCGLIYYILVKKSCFIFIKIIIVN